MTQDETGVRVVARAAQRRVRWKNGLGWTTELAVWPEGAEFDWRVSVAEVEVDCEFSRFPGIDRSILVIEGAGFDLRVDGEPVAQLRAGGPAHAFSGDRAARCVAHGPSRDFNVMTRRGRSSHRLIRASAAAAPTLVGAAGVGWVVYVVRGEATVGGARVEAGECAVIEPVLADRPAVALAGTAELVIAQLRIG